jgi:hypothetical protein
MKTAECVALMVAVIILGIAVGYAARGLLIKPIEKFDDFAPPPEILIDVPVEPSSYDMNTPAGGGCTAAPGAKAPCPSPDPSKWVLRATIPPCPPQPDLSKYMLKTECPPLPDMSKYVLKSSVPKCPPCISTCSKPCKIGECPACPRPRCPVVKCPDPKACPACPAAQCAPCPEPNIRCKADYQPGPVRPMLASTNTFGF